MSAEIFKTLGQLEAMAHSAHKRIDDTNDLLATELKEIHALMGELRDYMHTEKGKAAGSEKTSDRYLYYIGIGGAAIGGLLTQAIKFLVTGSL